MSETPDRHRRLRAIFDEALLQDPSAREAYVDRACASDPDLRPDVLRLLAAHARAQSFLERPPHLPPAAVSGAERFAGTDRFHVVRRVGAGGMGVVYEVRDTLRDDRVALKTFLRSTAGDLYRLKREFRSLADVSHPNLVCLYELFVEDDRGFFTMEMVDGVSFVDHVRGADRSEPHHERIVHAFQQLVEGVSALHRRGKLHRDIKPSNVLVTAEGRVVILDFGLSTELRARTREHSGVIAGTPAYISPEEASGAPPSEASDWYAVGVTLYEALTGVVPFAGPIRDVLGRKAASDPAPPADVAPGVPADLSAICMALLSRDPDRRLTGAEALRRLASAASPPSDIARTAVRDAPFVGRVPQLRELRDAFDAVASHSAKVVAIHGPSGIGKSALVRRFLGQLAARADVVVLSGRCYENESVPYKALDGVIDDMSRYLLSIPREDVEQLLPADVPALTRVFPVMMRVAAIARVRPDHDPAAVDPIALRRRAFTALRELLERLADRQPLVMCIDDLQWADADSVVLLEELLRPPSPPTMLTLVCFRSEEAAKPFLRAFLDRAGRDIWSAMPVGPMPDEEARTLIGALRPTDAALTDDDERVMTREASGSPFVLEQLARYVGISAAQGPTFAQMFAARLDALTPEARRFLETLAICGRPMTLGLVCDACGVARDRQSLVAMLRSSQLIRSSGSSDRVETYHDRIREVLAAQLPPDAVRGIHQRMVQVLVDRRSDDCEALFDHYRGAGDPGNASVQAALAGAKANAALAFDRAVFFYREALALMPAASAAPAWKEALAGVLVNAGRPAEAADAYLAAAREADRSHRVELQRRAAEQFLTGGHLDRGLDLIRTMLRSMGVRVPPHPAAALLSLWWGRARLRWRGLRFVPKRTDELDPDVLLRIDACWSATTGMALVDMISASDFCVQHLLMALDAGEPYRLARGMAMESAARGAYPTGRTLGAELGRQSKALAERVGNPHATALCQLADGLIAMTVGDWKTGAKSSDLALATLRDKCIGVVGVTWELNIAQNLLIWSLMYLGEVREVSERVPPLLAIARSGGNLYLVTELCTRANYAWLVVDKADEGEREVTESITQWSQKGFHRQHYSAMLARIQTALYRGDAAAAWRLFTEHEAALRRSLLTRVQLIRIEAHYLKARGAIAMAARGRDSRRFLSIARACARRIARERMVWSDPIALLLRACIAHLERQIPLALTLLHDAVDRFTKADMQLYVAVARRRIAALQHDAAGRDLGRQADAWMAAQAIKNPTAMTRMLAPGFGD